MLKVAPAIIPVIAAIWGWRGALIFGGIGGFVTLALWLWFARGVKFEDKVEAANRDFVDEGAPYGRILMERRTWAIVIAKMLSDATWWLINFWLPDFYRKEFGLTTGELAIPLAAIIGQLLKQSLKETMHLDYVTLARTQGYSEAKVIWSQALVQFMRDFEKTRA